MRRLNHYPMIIIALLIVCITPAYAQSDETAKIRALFEKREQPFTDEAYEVPAYEALVKKHQSKEYPLNFSSDIAALKKQLAQVKADKAKSPSTKLDEKEADLKEKIAHFEVQDAANLSYYSQAEYERLSTELKDIEASKKSSIQARDIVFKEVTQLKKSAESNMQEAAEIMAKGYAMKLEIDRADNGRYAFAKELLAHAQLQQAIDIANETPLLLKYTNSQLEAIIQGKDAGVAAGNPAEAAAQPEPVAAIEEKKVETPTPKEEPISTVSEPLVVQAAPKTEPAPAPKPAPKPTPPPVAEPIAEVKKEAVKTAPVPAEKKTALQPEAPKKETAPAMASVSKKTASAPSPSSHPSAAKLADMCQTNGQEGSVYFTVQIGAFDKPVSEQHFKKFGQVCVDVKNDAKYVKYTTGHFSSFTEAIDYLHEVQAKGIDDAWITAYHNGRRVTIKEAQSQLEVIR